MMPMKSFILLLLLAATSAFAPAQRRPVLMIQSQAAVAPSLITLNGVEFDEYSQTEPTQDLGYEDTLIGTGDMAMEGKVVTVAYKGTLMESGKTFDEGSISFRLGEGRVIAGWERGLVGMKVGGKRILKIPPQLAYGDRGAGDAIPPGAHLQFDCELKSIASNQMEEKVAELSSNSLMTATVVFVGVSLIYDLLHFVLHII